MSSKPSKQDKKKEQVSAAVDNATLASMLHSLKADLLTNPDSLSARFENKLGAIETKLDGIQSTVNNHEQRISDVEYGLNDLQRLEAQVIALADDNAKLKAKVLDLEGRSRRCNLRLIGLPESIEGTRPTVFFSNLLVEVLGKDVLPSPPELERAHRALREKPAEGEKPRAVIICFHKFQTKEAVIRSARQRRDELKYNDAPVYIYEDYTQEVQEQRAEYKEVMQQLYMLQLKPSLKFPARLSIKSEKGKRRHLKSVRAAEQFLATYKAASRTEED